MALIDYTYFQKRLLAIPNLQDSVLDQLNDYINIYEDQFFDIILGVKLKNQFLTGLEEAVIEDRWLALRDGKEYDISGITYRWRGFVNSDKFSPLANYTFCNFTADNQHLNTGIGEVRKKAENSVIITPQYRISAVWNEMIDMNKSLLHFLREFESEDYDDLDINYCKYKSLISNDFNIGL